MASAGERQAKHRAKIRENPELYKAFLEKDRKRKGSALITAKAQMTAKQREEFLMKECLQLRKLRAAKKPPQNSGESSNATPYCSSWSLGKAVKRARTSLPKSPKKQRCVVSKLAESVGLKVVGPSTPSTPPHAHGSALVMTQKGLSTSFVKTATFHGRLLVAKIESTLERALKGERRSRGQSRYDLCSCLSERLTASLRKKILPSKLA